MNPVIKIREYLNKAPAIKLLVAAVPGYISGTLINPEVNLLLYLFAGVLAAVMILIRFRLIRPAYLLAAAAIGFYVSSVNTSSQVVIPDKMIGPQKGFISGEVVRIISFKEKYCRVLLEGSLNMESLPLLRNEKILLTIFRIPETAVLKPGTILNCEADIRPPVKRTIPEDFPEKKYLQSLDAQWIAVTGMDKANILGWKKDAFYYRSLFTDKIKSRVNELFDPSSSGIVTAVLTGDRSYIKPEMKKRFSLTGTAHILAISGLHIGLISILIYTLLGFLRNPFIKLLFFLILLGAFIFLTGFQPSAVRAGIMASLYLIIKTMQRKANIFNVIALTVLIIALLMPSQFYSAGFRLSIAAVTGIAVFFYLIRRFFRKFIKSKSIAAGYLLDSLAVTFSTSIVISPLVADYFGIYPIMSPLMNIIIVPLMSIGIIFSAIAVIISFVSMALASFYAAAAGMLINLSDRINGISENIPWTYPEGSLAVLIAFLTSAILIYVFTSGDKKVFGFRIVVSSMFFAGVFFYYSALQDARHVKIYPRTQLTVLEANLGHRKKLLLLSDRKPAQYPFRDIALENHINKENDTLFLCYTGNAGINVCDNITDKKSLKINELDIESQEKLGILLNLKKRLPQIIEY